MTEQEFVLEFVKNRIRKVLRREKSILLQKLYNNSGRGANPWEFQNIVKALEREGFLTITLNERKKEVLTLAEQPAELGFIETAAQAQG